MPTPIDDFKQPDLTPLVKASQSIAKVLKGDIVVYESIYPGATEEVVFQFGTSVWIKTQSDFLQAIAQKRINPGDKLHRVTNISKSDFGFYPKVADFVDEVYQLIVTAGTHKEMQGVCAAEAAKRSLKIPSVM